jgi:hypothetical protein
MTKGNKRAKKTWAKWRKLVSEQARSGLDVTAFCHERALGRAYFHAWKKRLRDNGPRQFLEVQVAEAAPSAASDWRVEIRLRNGRSLMVGREFDAVQVRALLAVVETAE